MNKQRPTKRISQQNIVGSTPVVLSEDNPDLLFLNNNKITKKTKKKKTTKTVKPFFETADVDGFEDGFEQTTDDDPSSETVNLSDIESIVVSKYYDPNSKEQRGRAVIRIRNSHSDPDSVGGVDARIFNPNVN